MRILHLLPTLTGAGAERQVAVRCLGLRDAGDDVMVGYVHHGPGTWPASVPAHRFASQSAWSPALVVEIVALIRRWRADVVHTVLPRMDVAGGIAAAIAGVPLVIDEPNSAPSYGAGVRSRLRVAVARRFAAAVIANSPAGARYWESVAPELPAHVIPNSVPFAEIVATPPAPRPPHRFTAIYAGRLEPQKRVDVFLRACAAVMAERDLFVRICGDGSERERLERLARELGIAARVEFTGFVTDVWRYLRAADLFALLSDFEGEPNAMLESFAAGVPVILSDTEPHHPFAHAALLVPLGDVAATAAAIGKALDGEARERVAAATQLAATRTPEANVAACRAVYADVGSPRRHGLHVGIDASNLRSGGPITHVTELLRHARPASHGIARVTVWGGRSTLARIGDLPWLTRVHVPQLDRALPWRVAWQLLRRPRLTRRCDVLFAPGVTPVRGFEPYVSMSQNMQPFDGRERARYPFSWAAIRLWLLRWLQARAFRKSAAVIFLTDFARDWIGTKAGVRPGRSSVIAHGVPDGFRQPPRPARPLASYTEADPFRIVYVSDFYVYKHHGTIAEAVCRLRDEGLPVMLELIGAPVEPAVVSRLHETLARHPAAARAVRIIGPMPQHELPRVYRDAGAFVFASTCENLPLTLIEAMASALPIAAAAERPMTDILGDGAVYFDAEDVQSATDALRTLVVDAQLRERLARANYEASAAYSWRRCADETFALLASVARGRESVTDLRERAARPPRSRRQARG
ncbi:MAG TPA: glycosyltransferase [Thermoanaerobaculia bacterium]